jgi:hypothetical protein
LKDYSYARIDNSSKVHHFLKDIKTTELDFCKRQVTTSPNLHDDFASTVELYSTFINQMKAKKPQLNISEVSVASGKGGNNSFGKRGSSGISNVSNTAVDDRFFEKHEYHDLSPEQKNTVRIKRLKHDMLEMAMVEVVMEMEKATANAPLSNHSTALSRCWLQNLTNSTCQMIVVMMMNPWRNRKVLLTVPTPL